jgi:hypothetical protein
MVAVFIFFVAIEPLRNLQGESRLLQGYDVTEVHSLKATHTGAEYDSENCIGCGEKQAANLSPSTQTWRCCNRHGVCDNSFFPWRIGG